MTMLKWFAAPMIVASLMVVTHAQAAEHTKKPKMVNMEEFMKACDMDHDGMVTKAEMIKHMEKMFDKVDTGKTGKLDRKKAEDFLKQFTAPSGA